MHRTLHAAMAADMAGVLVVLESYFHRVRDARSHDELRSAADEALVDLHRMGGQPTGRPLDHHLKPI